MRGVVCEMSMCEMNVCEMSVCEMNVCEEVCEMNVCEMSCVWEEEATEEAEEKRRVQSEKQKPHTEMRGMT